MKKSVIFNPNRIIVKAIALAVVIAFSAQTCLWACPVGAKRLYGAAPAQPRPNYTQKLRGRVAPVAKEDFACLRKGPACLRPVRKVEQGELSIVSTELRGAKKSGLLKIGKFFCATWIVLASFFFAFGADRLLKSWAYTKVILHGPVDVDKLIVLSEPTWLSENLAFFLSYSVHLTSPSLASYIMSLVGISIVILVFYACRRIIQNVKRKCARIADAFLDSGTGFILGGMISNFSEACGLAGNSAASLLNYNAVINTLSFLKVIRSTEANTYNIYTANIADYFIAPIGVIVFLSGFTIKCLAWFTQGRQKIRDVITPRKKLWADRLPELNTEVEQIGEWIGSPRGRGKAKAGEPVLGSIEHVKVYSADGTTASPLTSRNIRHLRQIGSGLSGVVYEIEDADTGKKFVEKYYGNIPSQPFGRRLGLAMRNIAFAVFRRAPAPYKFNLYAVLANHHTNLLASKELNASYGYTVTPQILYTRYDEETGGFVQAFEYVEARPLKTVTFSPGESWRRAFSLGDEVKRAIRQMLRWKRILVKELGLWGIARQIDIFNLNALTNIRVDKEGRFVIMDLVPGIPGGIVFIPPFQMFEFEYFFKGLWRRQFPPFADAIDFDAMHRRLDQTEAKPATRRQAALVEFSVERWQESERLAGHDLITWLEHKGAISASRAEEYRQQFEDTDRFPKMFRHRMLRMAPLGLHRFFTDFDFAINVLRSSWRKVLSLVEAVRQTIRRMRTWFIEFGRELKKICKDKEYRLGVVRNYVAVMADEDIEHGELTLLQKERIIDGMNDKSNETLVGLYGLQIVLKLALWRLPGFGIGCIFAAWATGNWWIALGFFFDGAVRLASTILLTGFRYPVAIFIGACPMVGVFGIPAQMMKTTPDLSAYLIRKIFTGAVSKVPALGDRGTTLYLLANKAADLLILLLHNLVKLTEKIIGNKRPPEPNSQSTQKQQQDMGEGTHDAVKAALERCKFQILAEITEAYDYHSREGGKWDINTYRQFVEMQSVRYGLPIKKKRPKTLLNFSQGLIPLTILMFSLNQLRLYPDKLLSWILVELNLLVLLFIGTVRVAWLLSIISQIQYPVADIVYKKDGSLKKCEYFPYHKTYPTTWAAGALYVAGIIYAILSGSVVVTVFLMGLFATFLYVLYSVYRYADMEGHELSHIFQFIVLERIRQDLHIELTFKQLIAMCSKCPERDDMEDPWQKITEEPLQKIGAEPPTPEQLKHAVEVIFDEIGNNPEIVSKISSPVIAAVATPAAGQAGWDGAAVPQVKSTGDAAEPTGGAAAAEKPRKSSSMATAGAI